MEASEEQACIQLALKGELNAFDRLMVAWEDRLFSFLRTRGLSHSDAQDVLQETFLQAYRHLKSYRKKWRFSTWLFTIAVREAARSSKRAGSIHPIEVPADPASSTETPHDRYMGEELRQNIWLQARALVSDEQFTALWLFYVEEFDITEVARALRRSSPWVKVNLHRARKRLRVALASNDDGDAQKEDTRVRNATIRA